MLRCRAAAVSSYTLFSRSDIASHRARVMGPEAPTLGGDIVTESIVTDAASMDPYSIISIAVKKKNKCANYNQKKKQRKNKRKLSLLMHSCSVPQDQPNTSGVGSASPSSCMVDPT